VGNSRSDENNTKENEFTQADEEVGIGDSAENQLVVAERMNEEEASNLPAQIVDTGMVGFRNGLLTDYHKGVPSLLDRMERSGKSNPENMVQEMIREVIQESDHLLGNELVATNNGNLRDASIISGKRAEVLSTAIKAVQAKKAMEGGGIGVDVDAAAMQVVFRFFLDKTRKVFMSMEFDSEMKDTFFRMFKEAMKNWRKELRAELEGSSGNETEEGM
jgi:hypothetical protein